MDQIKSLWDGWEKQCFFVWYEGNKHYCADGWVYARGVPITLTVVDTYKRVANFLRQKYGLSGNITVTETPEFFGGPQYLNLDHDVHVITYANNVLKLTPDDFRRIDRETQIAEGMAAVETLVNAVPEAVYESK